jgi:hypothetical protein
MSVVREALIVAGATAAIGGVVSYVGMDPAGRAAFQYWPELLRAFAITGALLHLGAEYAGVNSWYCTHGAACVAPKQ